MIIIARQSFWIVKPFNNSVVDALEQFKSHGYEEKLKAQITSAAVPPAHHDLLEFLYDQILWSSGAVAPIVRDLISSK